MLCSWRSKIDPVLAAEESRSNFDIQQYGERILTRIQGNKDKDKQVRRWVGAGAVVWGEGA